MGGDHEGAQVEGCFPAGGRYPALVDVDDLAEGFDEEVGGEFRHGEPLGGALEAGGVFFGPEGFDAAVGLAVGFDAFEDGLPVVENAGGGRKL